MRLFIALETAPGLLPELQNSLQKFSRLSPRGINWVKPENLHLTLLFIGDVAENMVFEIEDSLSQILMEQRAFDLSATGYQLFPSRFPRIIWLGLEDAESQLAQLNRKFYKTMRQLNIDADGKKLLPHITLGRIKQDQSPDFERIVLAEPIDNNPYRYDTITLYRSSLKPEGPVYTPIQQFNLL